MTDNSNRSDPAKKVYTLPLSEKEIENELSLIFDPQICAECRQEKYASLNSCISKFEDTTTGGLKI
jgi:hypothetical protein